MIARTIEREIERRSLQAEQDPQNSAYYDLDINLPNVSYDPALWRNSERAKRAYRLERSKREARKRRS